MSRAPRFLWRLEYQLHEAVERYLALGNYWRAAPACVALGLLALNPWRR
jgi:hypothetical protein